jgi:CRISPR/Cas system CSM-associated protein Csm5 (group 7 of RAMP superfamily)
VWFLWLPQHELTPAATAWIGKIFNKEDRKDECIDWNESSIGWGGGGMRSNITVYTLQWQLTIWGPHNDLVSHKTQRRKCKVDKMLYDTC